MRKSVPVMGLLFTVSAVTGQIIAALLSLLFFVILLLLPERKEAEK